MRCSLSNSILFLSLFLGSVAFAAGQAPHTLVPESAMDSSDTSAGGDDDNPAPTIHMTAIAKPSISGFGTLEPSTGGLSADIWNGSSAQSATDLMSELHTGIASDPLRDLAARLLMSQANPPAGAGDDWFIDRVNALIAIGLDEKADQMIASVPASMMNDTLRSKHAELMLLRGEADNACKLAAASPDVATSFWIKLTILCKARTGKKDEAMVGIDMLGEQSPHDELFLPEAIRKLSDKTSTVKSVPKEWSIFDVALLRLINEPGILKDHIDAFPPVTLKYIAADAALDSKIRDKAAIRAVALGILPIKEGNKTPEQPFTRPLASDVTTLVTALGSGKPANGGDNAVIARLELGEGAAIQDERRVLRLLTLMEPFGYTVPAPVWQKLFVHKMRYDGETPPAVLVNRLNEAAHASRKGEVILLCALIMDGMDADRTVDLALLPIIRALQASGFEKEARLMAYNAVKAYGR